MKQLAVYDSYDRANELQLALLSAGIDAAIKHILGAGIAMSPSYAVFVEDQYYEVARDLLKPQPDPDYRTILRCPYCGSRDVNEVEVHRGFGAEGPSLILTLMIPVFYRWYKKVRFGTEWHCDECENNYRTNP